MTDALFRNNSAVAAGVGQGGAVYANTVVLANTLFDSNSAVANNDDSNGISASCFRFVCVDVSVCM